MSRQLVALRPRHHAAIRLKLNGASGKEIAEAVGLATVYLWMGDPLVQDELERQLQRVNDGLAQRIATASLAALQALTEIVARDVTRDPSPMEKLAVAKEILDRYEQLRTQRQAQALAQIPTVLQAPR